MNTKITSNGLVFRRGAWIATLFLTFACPAVAATIDGVGTYRGTISSVAVNFYAGVGVSLTDGVQCNGMSVVVLPYSDAHFKEMHATLLAAQASGQNVRMYRMADLLTTLGGFSYCTITTVSLGDFPYW